MCGSSGDDGLAANTAAWVPFNHVLLIALFWGDEKNGQVLCPIAGTFRNLTVTVQGAPAAANDIVSVLRVNAASTAITCTIANPAITASDKTHSAHVNAGDLFCLQISSPAGIGVVGRGYWGIEFEADGD